MTAAVQASAIALLRWAVVVGVLTAVVLLRPAAAQEPAGDEELLAAGAEHYQQLCAACHGTDGGGVPGVGRNAGPAVVGIEVALVDVLLRTGRMPLPSRSAGVVEEHVTDEQRMAIVAWMTEAFDLRGAVPAVHPGSPGRGQDLYVFSCAACHGSTGQGGIAGDGTLVPPVLGLDGTAIVEAARVGPFEMPRFEDVVLTDEELGDIAAFVEQLEHRPVTPLGLAEVDSVQAAGLVGVLSLLLLGGVFMAARDRGSPTSRPEDEEVQG